jgi:hypothetical protein
MRQISLYEYVKSRPGSPLYEAALKATTDPLKLLKLPPHLIKSQPLVQRTI